MLNYCLIFLSLIVLLLIIGLIKNRNIFIKILFLNTITNIIALFICFLGTFTFNDTYVDIAIIYLLLSFIATLAYLKYFSQSMATTN